MSWPTPEAACGRLPLKGAMPAARLSRFRGYRDCGHALRGIGEIKNEAGARQGRFRGCCAKGHAHLGDLL